MLNVNFTGFSTEASPTTPFIPASTEPSEPELPGFLKRLKDFLIFEQMIDDKILNRSLLSS